MKFSTLFAANVRLQWDRLVAASSISGYKFALIAESRVTRCLWYLNCFALLLMALLTIWHILDKYNENPTLTVFETNEPDTPINFPSVFICPKEVIDEGKREQFIGKLKAKFNLTLPDEQISECITIYAEFQLQEKIPLKECEDIEQILEQNMLEETLLDVSRNNKWQCMMTYPYGKLFPTVNSGFRQCILKGDPINCEDLFHAHFTETGFCFVLNNAFLKGAQQIRGTGCNTIELYEIETDWDCNFEIASLKGEVEIFLKDVYEITSFKDTGDLSGLMLYDGDYFHFPFVVQAGYYDNDVRYLSKRTCYFDDETAHFDHLRQHFIQDSYQQSVCHNIWHAHEFFKRCQCVPKFYRNLFPYLTYPGCKLRDLECCQQNFDFIRFTDDGGCLRNCNSTRYEYFKEVNPEIIYTIEDISHSTDFLKVRISLANWPLLRLRTFTLNDWHNVLVSIGGVTGLMLGFNFMILIEWIYQFTLRLFYAFHTDEAAIRQKAQSQHNSKLPCLYLGWRPRKNITN